MPRLRIGGAHAPAWALSTAPMVLLLASCDLSDSPISPARSAAAGQVISSQTRPGFNFLPPLQNAIAFAGTFDGTRSPLVEVCRPNAGNGCADKPFQSWSGSFINIDPVSEHYGVNWATHTSLGPGVYRIRVLLDETLLGYADVQLDAKGRPGSFRLGQTVPIRFRIEQHAIPRAAATLDGRGGSLALAGYGALIVPPGSLPAPTSVRVAATASEVTHADYVETLSTVDTRRVSWELRINAGNTQPAGSLQLRLDVPADFESALPSGLVSHAWRQVVARDDHEIHDTFEPSVELSRTATALTIELPAETFTDLRTTDGSYEAVVVLGVRPMLPAEADMQVAMTTASSACPLPPLQSPLGNRRVTGRFRHPAHKGTDYAAAHGDDVVAARDGVVQTIGWNVRELAAPDPRSGLMIKGWGRYVRLLHEDSSTTLYAHFIQTSTSHLKLGQRVSAGDRIGDANSTGGSTGNHLHLEYRTRTGEPADPEQCMQQDVGPLDFSVSPNTPIYQTPLVVTANKGSEQGATAWTWDFGDGRGAKTGTQSMSYQYSWFGTYTITLAGVVNGTTETASKTVTVRARPRAWFTVPLGPHTPGQPITFDGSAEHWNSSDNDGQIVAYAWDFGDSGTAASGMASHTYTASGIYTVTLTVTDNDKLTHSFARTVYVGIDPPLLNPTWNAPATMTPASQQWVVVSGHAGDHRASSGFTWSIDDVPVPGASSNQYRVTAGSTPFTLRVTFVDNYGQSYTLSRLIHVDGPPVPIVACTQSGCDASGSLAYGGQTITGYEWSITWGYLWRADWGTGYVCQDNSAGSFVNVGSPSAASYIVTPREPSSCPHPQPQSASYWTEYPTAFAFVRVRDSAGRVSGWRLTDYNGFYFGTASGTQYPTNPASWGLPPN